MTSLPASTENLETPSGKRADNENFPVGSFLIARKLRPHVATYYAFARAGDDISDDPTLSQEQKIKRLTAFETALLTPNKAGAGTQKAIAAHHSLNATEISLERARKLLDAFRQDALKNRTKNWADLLDYCTKSADPVGRFLLDLHKEDPALYEKSDALCTLLQILNHVQDCGKDKAEINRVYIPDDLLTKEGLTVSALDEKKLSSSLRTVLNRVLKECEPLIKKAEGLPSALKSRRLAAESATILYLAKKLHKKLQIEDPLAKRVKPSKIDFLKAAFIGIFHLIIHKPAQ